MAPSLALALPDYPGRGVVLYRKNDGEARWVYFVTGRSESSRRRRFIQVDGQLAVSSLDSSSEPDPLRHYVCSVGTSRDSVVVGNGDHVTIIASALDAHATLADAVADLVPEPDPPINTPRIAAVLADDEIAVVAILLRDGQIQRRVQRVDLAAGKAFALHTYGGTVDAPLGSAPSLAFSPPPGEVAEHVWQLLDSERRVLLAEGSAQSALPDRVMP